MKKSESKSWDRTWGKIYWDRTSNAVLTKVSKLIEKGANVNIQNENGFTPLMWAAAFGQEKTVEKLIQAGADVNFQDERGRTALMFAVGSRKTATAKVLLENNAFVNSKDLFGFTSLMLAAENNDTETFRVLLEHGADLHAENSMGGNVWDSTLAGSEIRRLIRRTYVDQLLHKVAKHNDVSNVAKEERIKKR